MKHSLSRRTQTRIHSKLFLTSFLTPGFFSTGCINNNNNNNNNNNGKRLDGTTLLPWAKGKTLAWDVTVPDTYTESYIANMLSTPGAAADQAAQQKISKYASLVSTHIFCPIAIETAGTWNAMAIELVQGIGRRITVITADSRETTFMFQRLSIALQQGNAVSFQNTMTTE